jgi:anaerobic selenocysteine-containing dehydrogenase
MYCKGKRVIMCWAMGITQHRHSVPTIQEIVNLMLLRGNIGAPGAGLCPVRGHSNVQGDRTMGINERPPVPARRPRKALRLQVPRHNGHNTVEAIHAMLEGRAKVFIGLGGNFAQATPTPRTAQALRNCELTVQISTKLNRSHLVHGKGADPAVPGPYRHRPAGEGPQAVTVEDSFSMVHASNGQLKPLSRQMRSEPAVVAGIAAATLGKQPVDWHWLVADYDRIRDLIADTIPALPTSTSACAPGGFYLGNSAASRQWNTATGRANFKANLLPDSLLDERVRASGCRT